MSSVFLLLAGMLGVVVFVVMLVVVIAMVTALAGSGELES